MIYTTLNNIKEQNPDEDTWSKLVEYLGTDFNPNAKISLLTILDSNGFDDTIWALQFCQDDKFMHLLVHEFVQHGLQTLIETAEKFRDREVTEDELATVRKSEDVWQEQRLQELLSIEDSND